MKLTGNILNIKNKRDSKNAGIELLIDRVEYVTHKKDGKYYQPFNLIVDLEEPVVITGDQLARMDTKHLEEGEYDFQVYDKVEDDYVLNENKFLSVLMMYDEEEQQSILSSVEYTVTVSNDEYKDLKAQYNKEKKAKKGKK
ncbi:hypothetical protein [Pontibacter ruber]|uniref:DUF3127 domain-containing protein n=1 Tax=Pontibacter ruber TaxID=1343895 RepID=A0ABW5CZQ5_9BACT|nr:hypothetical protein [Pontibacter ruber]